MREILLRHPEVITVVSQHGRPDNGSDASPFSNVELFAPLKPYDEWPAGMTKDKLTAADCRQEFDAELPGVVFNFSQYIQDNVEEALSGVKGANSVKIIGPNLQTCSRNYAGAGLQTRCSRVKGMEDLGIFHIVGQPNLNIKVDRVKAARYGLNTGDVNAVIQAAMARRRGDHGARKRSAIQPDGAARARVPRQTSRRSATFTVAYQTRGGDDRLYPVARTRRHQLGHRRVLHLPRGNAALHPDQVQRARPRSRQHGGGSAGAHREEYPAAERLSHRVGRRVSGPAEPPRNALAVFVPDQPGADHRCCSTACSIRVRDSLLALAGIPFAVAGGVLALFVSGLPFSISAAIGFISLFGVSVMNGILVLTYFNELTAAERRRRSTPCNDAAEKRMRPLLMTALSACIGLFPAALSHGIGSQVQRPLATVVVGGMLIGPLMLLMVVPALQLVFLRKTHDSSEPAAESTDV